MPDTPFANPPDMDAAASASQAQWVRFFDEYAGFIFGIARNEGLSDADADEIVQMVMLELVGDNAASRYDQSLGPFQSWLSRLTIWRARNLRLRNIRRENAHKDAGEAEKAEKAAVPRQTIDKELEQATENEWMATVTAAALDRLRTEVNPTHFQAYYASAIEKMDAEAVSRLCGVKPNNLYQIRRRVGTRFRAILEETMRDLDEPSMSPVGNIG